MSFPGIWSDTFEEDMNSVAQLLPTASVGAIASLITPSCLPFPLSAYLSRLQPSPAVPRVLWPDIWDC